MFYNVEAHYCDDDRYTGPLLLEEAMVQKEMLVHDWGLAPSEVFIVQR
ncbi:hypothetical protein JK159_09375 [Weissella minor]|nr:hypothetical protein [Weissella minor]MBS0950556.1 hypothetical protein [Weissella minor]